MSKVKLHEEPRRGSAQREFRKLVVALVKAAGIPSSMLAQINIAFHPEQKGGGNTTISLNVRGGRVIGGRPNVKRVSPVAFRHLQASVLGPLPTIKLAEDGESDA